MKQMPLRPLKPEHEQFAQLVAAGKPITHAYAEVYAGNRESCEQSASRLYKQAKIKARIRLIRDRFSAALAVSQADALSSQVVQETVKDVLSLAEKRSFLASLVRTPVGQVDEQSPLAQEVTESTDEKGNTRKTVKMAGKLKALELDARLAGELDSKDVGLQVNILSVGGSVTTGI